VQKTAQRLRKPAHLQEKLIHAAEESASAGENPLARAEFPPFYNPQIAGRSRRQRQGEKKMNSSEMRRFDMFTRVRDFGASRSAAFPAASLGGRSFAEITAVIEALTAQTVAKTSGMAAARESTSGKAAARDALRDEMEMMTRTARAMAIDTPGLDDKFRQPRSNADQALLSAARTFRADAEPLKSGFIEHDMPADFLETLDGLISDFEQLLVSGHQSAATHIAASAAIDAEIERGMTAARRLDSIVRNRFHNDPGELAAWESARHIERVGRKAPKKPAAAPPSDNS
jgi:hypothetical protein